MSSAMQGHNGPWRAEHCDLDPLESQDDQTQTSPTDNVIDRPIKNKSLVILKNYTATQTHAN